MKNDIKKITYNNTITITEDKAEQRIDNFLIKNYKKIPKSALYKIIRTGKLKINKKKVKPQYKLKIGDYIYIPIKKSEDIKNTSQKINIKIIQNISNNILYEDKYLLVINKECGIAVHGGSGINLGIIETIRILKPKNHFLELVHRLDRGTSGVLILAKKRSILRHLHQQLREKKIKKNYLALVHGIWPIEKKKISAPILKINKINSKNIVEINKKGKQSETYFSIQHQYRDHTLIKAAPITGRTHQIRIHTAYIGHPIVLDKKYGKKELDYKIKRTHIKNRLLLHANDITFIHPYYKKQMTIVAPLENNFKKYLNII